jgi:hypothetical protein
MIRALGLRKDAVMKTCLACLVLLTSLARSSAAQDHLLPNVNAFAEPDGYLLKMRHIFAQAFDGGVILRALVLPSFENEYVVGLQDIRGGVEAFVLEPSFNIWHTQLVEDFEDEIKELTRAGEAIPPETTAQLKKLKGETPADYRTIKATRHACALPREVSEEIRGVWKKMLLDVRHPKEPRDGLDGITYHFSAFFVGWGELSGEAWSPDAESKTGRLVSLAEALGDYARGKVDLNMLTKTLEQAKRAINR